MKLKLFTLLATIALVSFVIYQERFMLPQVLTAYAAQNSDININSKVPNFEYKVFDTDKSNNLYNINSDKTYIHFWATWCHVCTKEFNHIIAYAKKNPNTTILAVSIDDDETQLKEYLNKINSKLSKAENIVFVWDYNKAISQDLFNTMRVPETYLINKDHKIIDKTIGPAKWK